MMNSLAKMLVLVHTTLSVAGMIWAITLVLQAQDFGWIEPYREVFEHTKEGGEKTVVRHASEYDKSHAALVAAANTRDGTYIYVKPAIDELQSNMPKLPDNHRFYLAKLDQLKNAKDKIEVVRLLPPGINIDANLEADGKPKFEGEDKVLKGVTQSRKAYEEEFAKLLVEVDGIEKEIREIVTKTKKITMDMTGTDDDNKYIQPGMYQLTDLEFKSQSLLKTEMDDIKPFWSKAVEQARLFQYRRIDLEATLEKLKAARPPQPALPEKKM